MAISNENGNLSICSQCGFLHPPLPIGKTCPMAKVTTNEGNIVDFDKFFHDLKNILTSQIQSKNIKDTKKFLGNILVDITKLSEEYKEN